MNDLPIVVTILALICYLRQGSKDDYVRLDTDLKRFRQETSAILKAIRDEIRGLHERLDSIEARHKQEQKEKGHESNRS